MRIEKASGCYVYDYSGKKYFDFTNSLSPLGANEESVVKAIQKKIKEGIGHSFLSKEYDQLLATLKYLFPTKEEFRFVNSFFFREIPVHYPFYYPKVVDDCHILILKGFSGCPLQIITGKKSELDRFPIYTPDILSIVSANATIAALRTKYLTQNLCSAGEIWLKEFNSIWPEAIRIEGFPTYGYFVGKSEIISRFFEQALISGLIFGPEWFFNFPLAEKSKITLSAIKDIILRLKSSFK